MRANNCIFTAPMNQHVVANDVTLIASLLLGRFSMKLSISVYFEAMPLFIFFFQGSLLITLQMMLT